MSRRMLALMILALAAPGAAQEAQGVSDYRVLFALCRAPRFETPLVVLRTFTRRDQRLALAVDPESLATRVLPADDLKLDQLSWDRVREVTRETPYGQAMADSEQSATAEQDAGIVHALTLGNGVVLTIDLCPSARPLDRRLFTTLILDFAPAEKPVPVGIAITGRWMIEHPKDLAWLRQREREGEIAVTWINHSFNHRYDERLPLSQNFLLESGTDPDLEVLATEKAMIDQGLLPSVFFRFPGLVSDPKLVGRIVAYGLIPVGSDAWLAKNQVPSAGSIVLVHGNGNEPVGVDRLLALVKQERRAIREKSWLLSDLPKSVSRAERSHAWTVARTVRERAGKRGSPTTSSKRAGIGSRMGHG